LAPLSLPAAVDVAVAAVDVAAVDVAAVAVACNNSSRAVDLSVRLLWEIVGLPFAAKCRKRDRSALVKCC